MRIPLQYAKLRRAVLEIITSRLHPLAVAAVVVQTGFLVALFATDGYDAARSGEIFRLLATYAGVVALFVAGQTALSPWPRAGAWALFALYALLVAMNFARFETAGTFDYAFVHYNARELLTPLGRRIVGGHVKLVEIVGLLVFPIAVGMPLARRPLPAAGARRAAWLVASTAVVVGLPAARIRSHETVTSFIASAARFHAQARAAQVAIAHAPYPYLRRFTPSERAREIAGDDAPRPHVILLFLESWSGRYVDRARPGGGTYTPVFDAHRREGLTFDYFYGNSVQSSRGRFATLCSLIPMYREKDFFALADAPLRCLPRLLADRGYRTLIASAADEPEFENSDVFFRHIGFAETHWEDPAARGHDPRVWGAGLQDDAFYEKFFRIVDDAIAREPAMPVFAVGINVSHHYPFSTNPAHVPAEEMPTKYARNYVGSLRAADAWLEVFFREIARRPSLRDAIVVLVGDHSFPADEHGIHFNGLGAHEESFRTAFTLIWPGHVPPRVVKDRAASQIDIAPTIADLLQLRHKSHFVGKSLVADDDDHDVPLVQPYDGVRLGAVRFPYKLESHEAAEQEHLYDIVADPDEEHDLVDDPAHAGELAELRRVVARIRTNEVILHQKNVWPPSNGGRRCRRDP